MDIISRTEPGFITDIGKIIFVCTGNICRSPMALGIALSEVKRRRLILEISSAGTAAMEDSPPSVNAYTVCLELGIDISQHRARQVAEGLNDPRTLFVAMAQNHVAWLRSVAGIPPERVIKLGSGIPDPYGGNVDVYRRIRDIIEMEVRDLLGRLEPYLERITPEEAVAVIPAIVPMTLSDVREVAELEQKCFTDPWGPTAIAEEIDNPGAAMIVAMLDGVLCGYGCVMISSDAAYIPRICVRPAYRRNGIARALMNELQRIAEESGCTEIVLDVRESNSPAIALYNGLGYITLGRRANFYESPNEAARVMKKSITPWSAEANTTS